MGSESLCTVECLAPGLFFVVAKGKVDEKMAREVIAQLDAQARTSFHLFVDGGDIVAYTPGYRSEWTRWISKQPASHMLGIHAFLRGSLTNMALAIVNLATGGRIKGHPSRESLMTALAGHRKAG